MPCPSHHRLARSEGPRTLAAFAGFAIVFVAAMDVRFPYWTDRGYSCRKCVLNRNEEYPGAAVYGRARQLARCAPGSVPEELGPIHDPDGGQISVINFSHLGAGPRMNLVQLHRLLNDGVVPKYLLVELLPAHLHHEPMVLSELWLPDIRWLLPSWGSNELLGKAAEYRLSAISRDRTNCLETLAPVRGYRLSRCVRILWRRRRPGRPQRGSTRLNGGRPEPNNPFAICRIDGPMADRSIARRGDLRTA